MPYRMSDLVERSGLTARTIRDYIRCGYLGPPSGHGPAATYSEEQLLAVIVIARLRAEKKTWPEVAQRLVDWSLKQKRAYVRKTDPPAPTPAAPAAEASPPALEGAPAARALPPGHPEAATTTELAAMGPAGADPLLAGRSFVMANVLPGLALIVDHDAPAIVKRVAAEIIEKYGVMGRGR